MFEGDLPISFLFKQNKNPTVRTVGFSPYFQNQGEISEIRDRKEVEYRMMYRFLSTIYINFLKRATTSSCVASLGLPG